MTSRRMLRGEEGAMAIELVLLAPVLVLLCGIIVMAGDFRSAANDVSNAAYAAARAASYTSDPVAAQYAGQTAAVDSMANRGDACASMTTSIDTSDFTPGGDIKVTVTCVAALAQITGFSIIPGHKTFTATAVVPIDVHRVM